MKLDPAVIAELTVHPGSPAGVEHRDTSSTKTNWLQSTGLSPKEVAEEDLRTFTDELKNAQELLWASDTHAILLVIQAMDAAGKDGTIKHVMSGVNPQGCEVVGFKQPSAEERGHDFLWRYSKALPERGRIGIFNRSYYEEVLVVRVHPELLAGHHDSSESPPTGNVWRHRFEDINAFEHHLHRNGTRIVKIFLHVSREQQKKRLLERLEDPGKAWKFSTTDLAERAHWDEYRAAYEDALSATSTPWAPWYVVPADHKYAARALVGGILVHTIDLLGLRPPEVPPETMVALAGAKAALLAE
jgi:PPK2 family polyphosphate:nucleotide phosphotransferase